MIYNFLRIFQKRYFPVNYQIYICCLTLIAGVMLYPLSRLSFVFCVAFVAFYHEGWDLIVFKKISDKISDWIWLYWTD